VNRPFSFLAAGLLLLGGYAPAFAVENIMPPPYTNNIAPDLAAKYTYIEDGDYTKALNIPTYQWLPVNAQPKLVVLGIHGLTLHGRRYRVLARMLAVNGVAFVAPDMRGFGRCLADDKKQFSTKDDDKTKVNHEKSYEEIVQLAELMRKKYPDAKLMVLGESLGCTFCVKLAAEHPDLVDGMVLSAPAVKVNPDMIIGHGTVARGMKAVVSPRHEVSLHSFFMNLVSSRPEVENEMIDDPLITKQLPLGALLATDKFVDNTADYGKKTSPKLPVLIIQGSRDKCVSPTHVTELMSNMPSNDQTLAWRGNYGHLQLETVFMRATVVDALVNFLSNHTKENNLRLKGVQQQVADLGGTLVE